MSNKKLIKKLGDAGFLVQELLYEKIDDSIKKLECVKEAHENVIATEKELQKEIFMIINNLEYISDLLEISSKLDYVDELTEEELDEFKL